MTAPVDDRPGASADRPQRASQPPTSVRVRFWLLGWRVEPLWRPWVAEQITHPRYLLRRQASIGALQLLFIAVPQLLLAVSDGGWWRLLIPAILLVAMLAPLLATRRQQELQTRKLLAFHGVTADGQLREPISAWQLMGYSSSTFTPVVTTLLVAQFVLVVTGGAIVVNHYTSPNRCQQVPADVVDKIEDALGRTLLPGAPSSTPPLFTDGRLRAAQRVDSGLDGLYFVAAYADGAPGDLARQPAVWRVIEPGGALPVPELNISAEGNPARSLTPTIGFSSGEENPQVDRVIKCTTRLADRQ